MKINVLSTEIANMIAAGEVVERPASVIKELTENCIDAGATSVVVEIKNGGVPYMRVTDNGCGIDAGELATAFMSHATSKIKSATDLDSIGTLGFRGEALASIAAVSRVEVFSKTPEAQIGACATIEAGKVLEKSEAGCPDGTTMIVRNLFFNTPARRKFLKSDSAEASYVTDVMTRIVLSHPEVAFHYISGGKTLINSRGDGKILNAIYSVFGSDYSKNMKEISLEEDGFRVHGYVGTKAIARKDRRHQFFFVNSRNIMSKIMSAAVSEAFKTTIMTGQYPVCVIKVEMDPKNVDVNVHPAKTEVRFADEKKVYSSIYWAVKNALTEEKYVPEFTTPAKSFDMVMNAPDYKDKPQMTFESSPPPEEKQAQKPEKATPSPTSEREDIIDTKTQPFFREPASVIKEDIAEERFSHINSDKPSEMNRKLAQRFDAVTYLTPEEAERIRAPKPPLPVPDVDFRLVGQVFGTYFIIQKDNEMLIIDQHAAHERICFEELLEDFRSNEVRSQIMLLPVTMTLTATEAELFREAKSFFIQLGFDIEPFGRNEIIVRATPGILEEQDIRSLVSDMLTLIGENRENIVRQLYEEALHMVACKTALKGNKVLSDTELKTLGAKVLALGEGINTCPHGRPIMMKMTKYNLERQFGRE